VLGNEGGRAGGQVAAIVTLEVAGQPHTAAGSRENRAKWSSVLQRKQDASVTVVTLVVAGGWTGLSDGRGGAQQPANRDE